MQHRLCYTKDEDKGRKTLTNQEGKETMKTLSIVKMPKGYYLTARYCGMMQTFEYYKTKTALNARVKELKQEGYALAV